MICSFLCVFHIRSCSSERVQTTFSLRPLDDVVECDVITYTPRRRWTMVIYLKKTKTGMLGVFQPLEVRHKHTTSVEVNILENQ